jgi:hypothetical protein
MDTMTVAGVEEFIDLVRSAGVDQVVIAWQDEYGPVPGAHAQYGHVAQLTVLAYRTRDGAILRLEMAGASQERAALAERLQAAGLRTSLRCRNLARRGHAD